MIVCVILMSEAKKNLRRKPRRDSSLVPRSEWQFFILFTEPALFTFSVERESIIVHDVINFGLDYKIIIESAKKASEVESIWWLWKLLKQFYAYVTYY